MLYEFALLIVEDDLCTFYPPDTDDKEIEELDDIVDFPPLLTKYINTGGWTIVGQSGDHRHGLVYTLSRPKRTK